MSYLVFLTIADINDVEWRKDGQIINAVRVVKADGGGKALPDRQVLQPEVEHWILKAAIKRNKHAEYIILTSDMVIPIIRTGRIGQTKP